MEIDIQSKTDNPLLKRTEVHFTIHHEGEKTPKRELVRTELADKLNVKKENILVNYMKSSFGSGDTIGFAKVYKSVKDAKEGEENHILKRNNIIGAEKKPEAKKEEKPKEEPIKPVDETKKLDEKPKEEEPVVEEKSEISDASDASDVKEKPSEDKSEEVKKSTENEKPAN